MAGGAADEPEILAVLEHRRQSPPRLHPSQEMASLPIPDELLVDIFLRLSDPADLVRASAGCVSFRRVAADRSFLRRYRKLHAPPLLGFLDEITCFHPAEHPYPSASAASAVALALAADFDFSFLPAPTIYEWVVKGVRDGRVLLDRICYHRTDVSKDMVVCDPLHRRYLVLPPITYDLAALVDDPLWTKMQYRCDIFLVPPGDDDEATAAEETSFRVIWMAQCETRLVAFVFFSNTGQWRAIPSQRWSDLFAGLLTLAEMTQFYSPQNVYGCFHWVIGYHEESKLLVLDTKTMEFSVAESPPEAKGSRDWAMVEAGEGRSGMFLLADDSYDLSYFIRQNDGGSSSQWHNVKTISLGCGTYMLCNMKKDLFVYQSHSSLLEAGCFRLDIETFQLEKVCALGFPFYKMHTYSNFLPSLLSSPTISMGCENRAEKEMLEQGCAASPSAESPWSE